MVDCLCATVLRTQNCLYIYNAGHLCARARGEKRSKTKLWFVNGTRVIIAMTKMHAICNCIYWVEFEMRILWRLRQISEPRNPASWLVAAASRLWAICPHFKRNIENNRDEIGQLSSFAHWNVRQMETDCITVCILWTKLCGFASKVVHVSLLTRRISLL